MSKKAASAAFLFLLKGKKRLFIVYISKGHIEGFFKKEFHASLEKIIL